MKVLVVSDTHRKNENFFRVLKKVGPVDMVIHCGDIEGSEYAIATSAECRVEMVAGNNDFFSRLPREKELLLEGMKVLVTHGHNYYVNTNPEFIRKEARNRGMDIVMYGPTHRPVAEKTDNLIVINPGSLTYPRQEGRRPSYAVLEIENHDIKRLEILYL